MEKMRAGKNAGPDANKWRELIEREKQDADKRRDDEVAKIRDQAAKDLDAYRRKIEEARRRQGDNRGPDQDLIDENERLEKLIIALKAELEEARRKLPKSYVQPKKVPVESFGVQTSPRAPSPVNETMELPLER